jgi:hypothetical protein
MKRVHVFPMILLSLTLMGVAAVDEPPSVLEVTLPDAVVSTIGGVDVVEIPGGDLLLVEQGRPQVPYFSVSQDYPPGYRVQDVRLLERSEPEARPGLNLPVVILEDQPDLPVEMLPGWYPEEDFAWRVWENMDGSSTLRVDLFPFRYHPESKDALFYKAYRFEVEYIRSDVTIQRLQAEIDDGGVVILKGWIQNSGLPQDIVVDTVIKRYGSDAFVDGLPIRHLAEFSGEGSFSAAWQGGGEELEALYAEVSLTDLSGNVLARNVAPLLKPPAEGEAEAVQAPSAGAGTPEGGGVPPLLMLALVGGLIGIALIVAGVVLARRG